VFALLKTRLESIGRARSWKAATLFGDTETGRGLPGKRPYHLVALSFHILRAGVTLRHPAGLQNRASGVPSEQGAHPGGQECGASIERWGAEKAEIEGALGDRAGRPTFFSLSQRRGGPAKVGIILHGPAAGTKPGLL